MMLTDLADVGRGAGLAVVESAGWQARGHGEMQGARCVVVHHTAGPTAGDAPSLTVVRDGRPDLAGPLAHIVLARSGTVHVVAAGLCWHTGAARRLWQSNAYAVGVEVENPGGPTDRYPPAQLDALARLCRALCARYDIPYPQVLGHREICTPPGRKVDPRPETLDMDAFRATLSTTQEDTMPTADQIAAAVWAHQVRNGFGDVVRADQILVATEQRAADLQTRLTALEQRLARQEARP